MNLIKRITVSLLFLLVVSLPAFALDGPITSPWGYRSDPMSGNSTMHDGLDIGIDSGTPIDSPCNGTVQEIDYDPSGYAWYVVIYDSEQDKSILFGHLDDASAVQVNPGDTVTKGQLIAYSGNGGKSTGPHLHVSMHAGPNVFSEVALYSENPSEYLTLAGWNLSGDSVTPSGGPFGSKRGAPDISWGIKGMYELGKDFSAVIKEWAGYANTAFDRIKDASLMLVYVLCLIDFCFPILLGGMAFSLRSCITKVMKYGGLIALIHVWTQITDKLILSFITTTVATASGNMTLISTNMSNPQLLLQHGIRLVMPGLNKVASFSGLEYLRQLNYILPIYLLSILVIAAFIILALYVTFVYIEFYISAGLSIVTVPFSAWHYAKFIPEGSLGHLVTSGLKLMLVSFMIGICVTAIQDSKPADIFKTGVQQEESKDSTPSDSTSAIDTSLAGNEYVSYIIEAANYYGIDPQIAISIAMRESGGDTVSGIHMANGGGIFQILDGKQDCWDATTKSHKPVSELYPDYETDARANCYAGVGILADKINNADGDIWKGVQYYNGGGDKNYVEKITTNYQVLTGHMPDTSSHTVITEAMFATYMRYCLGLTALVIVTLLVPKKIIHHLGGPLELP